MLGVLIRDYTKDDVGRKRSVPGEHVNETHQE